MCYSYIVLNPLIETNHLNDFQTLVMEMFVKESELLRKFALTCTSELYILKLKSSFSNLRVPS